MRKMLAAVLLALIMLLALGCAGGEELWYPPLDEDVPVIYLTTRNGNNHFVNAYYRDHKLMGLIKFVEGSVSVAGDEELQNAKAQLKVRGNYTLEYPKKSIRIRLEEKQNLLGLNQGRAYKDWVLLAEWKDLSMLHSPVGLFLAHSILGADGYYCTDCRFAQVYVNGEYWGLYLLVEQQEVNPGRVEITEAEKGAADYFTGYFLEYDAYYQEEQNLPGSDPVFFINHTGLGEEQYGYTIKSSIADERQVTFLQNYLRRIYHICYQAVVWDTHYVFNEECNGLDRVKGPTAQETISQVLDLRSLVDTYILHEILCNPDLGWSSFYMTLDLGAGGNRKLTFQAPWDFDSCFGIRSDYEASEGLYAANAQNPWIKLVVDEPWFQEMVLQRWAEIKAQGIPEKTLELIDTLTETYADEFTRNYERWPQRIAEGNHELIDELNSFTSQQEAADYLTRWLTRRFAYLDEQWQ